MDDNFEMLAKCFYGFEPVLALELRNLGAQEVKEGVRSVSFKGDKGFMYKANLALRTATRVLQHERHNLATARGRSPPRAQDPFSAPPHRPGTSG